MLAPRAQRFFELKSSFATEAKQVLDLIDELFAIEAPGVTGPAGDEMRTRLGADPSRPLAKQIEQWALSVRAFPESAPRKAVEYMGNMWSGLVLFLDDPAVPLHNNTSERALRGPVIGRVNHFGSRSKRGDRGRGDSLLARRERQARQRGTRRLPQPRRTWSARRGIIPLPREVAASL